MQISIVCQSIYPYICVYENTCILLNTLGHTCINTVVTVSSLFLSPVALGCDSAGVSR